MCGIFGAIGPRFNLGTVRALAIANRARGSDSIGFFNSAGRMVKSANDPMRALGFDDISGFIDRSGRDAWFIVGHTRRATHGKVTNRNAHPFRFGSIIGAHNGIVNYPQDRNYQVDSEYLFDSLNRHSGNYQAALADISGYWGLVWFDGAHLYLSAHDNSVYVAKAGDGAWYFSSDESHLVACIGKPGKVHKIDTGRTIRFSAECAGFVELPRFRSSAPVFVRSARWNTGTAETRPGPTLWADLPAAPLPAAPLPRADLPRADLPRWQDCPPVPRLEGYGRDFTDPFDCEDWEDHLDFSRMMDRDDYWQATEMAQELGYSDLEKFATDNNLTDLAEVLDSLDRDWDWEFGQFDGREEYIDEDIPF